MTGNTGTIWTICASGFATGSIGSHKKANHITFSICYKFAVVLLTYNNDCTLFSKDHCEVKHNVECLFQPQAVRNICLHN